MRHSLFIFSIILMAACGCGKNPAGQGGVANQETNQTSVPTGEQISTQAMNQAPTQISDEALAREIGAPFVDILVDNSSTNEFLVQLGRIDVPPPTLSAGQTATNTHIAWFTLDDATVTLTAQSGQSYIQDVPFAEVNKQIASGKYQRVRFRILDPGKVEVSCE